ncbi:response regulator [Hylemonella sp. W303a]|uniref:response regulator n=1 Tax=Hylemonella sp. W303a TaxID=3389873 RepID=UPI00396B1FFB
MSDTLAQALNRAHSDVVLIVDDVPDNLSLLHDALDESGCTVLVALDGASALQRAAQARPDIVLLDAMMPGMDGFEVARRLKADATTAHIPIIFMTGLTETEHLVAALEAGGTDYVTKPIRPKEVLARMQVHLQGARERRQARNALDAFGYASITVRASDGRLMWQTPLARELLARYYGEPVPGPAHVPEPVLSWLRRSVEHVLEAQARGEPLAEPPRLSVEQGARRLTLRLHQRNDDGATSASAGDWMLIMQEASDESVIEAISLSFRLTAKEAEVLYWVIKGKINRDIGDILGSSPMTVKKHLERVYAKLGVETRTAAAALAMNRIRQLHPQFEG